MGLVYLDRVRETTISVGTGDLSLAGAVTGFQGFASIGDGNTCYYLIEPIDSFGNPVGPWEIGVGTYHVSGSMLTRTTVLSSSNGGAAISLVAGAKNVSLISPAAAVATFQPHTLFLDQMQSVLSSILSEMYFNGIVYFASPAGNDANDGLTADTPITVSHAQTVASLAGTLVKFAAGTYALGASGLQFSDEVHTQGAGIDETIFTSTVSFPTFKKAIFRPGSKSLHRDFTVQHIQSPSAQGIPFGTSFGSNASMDHLPFIGVVAWRVRALGISDAFFVAADNACAYRSLTTIDCEAESNFDCFNAISFGPPAPTTQICTFHYNLTAVSTGQTPDGICRAFAAYTGKHFLFGGNLTVTGTVDVKASGVEANSQTTGLFGDIYLFGTTVDTSTVTGTASVFDLNNAGDNVGDNPGKITVIGAYYNTSAGAIGAIPVLGANVAAALAIGVGTAGAVIVNGGALGTPSGGALTNCTSYPAASLTGATLAAGVTASSLTSVGTLTTLAVYNGNGSSNQGMTIGNPSQGIGIYNNFGGGEVNLGAAYGKVFSTGGHLYLSPESSHIVQVRDTFNTIWLTIAAERFRIGSAVSDSNAANGDIFVGSDHGNALCFKDLSGTVRVINTTP